jgi:copper chaperone CopZ
MQTENFNVMNVRCGGCVTTITNGLQKIAGVAAVDVNISTGRVTVSGDGLRRDVLAGTLKELGYPEKP